MVMNNLRFTEFNNASLQTLAARLDSEYYDAIETLCEGAMGRANKLSELEVKQSASQYITLCNKLITEIRQYIGARKEYFLPYISELSAKDEANHNCTQCSGKCNMGHELKLAELKESHLKIKDILYRLQMASLPLYSETTYPDIYRILRNQMVLLENALTETFFIEESYLIPKVAQAQNKINAGN
jgi:hypothetical protein